MTILRRPDYFTVLGAAAILIGIAVIVGIVYTYANRPIALNDIGSRFHVFDHRQLPADL